MNSRSRYRHLSVRTPNPSATVKPTEAAAARELHNPKGLSLANATARIVWTNELVDQEVGELGNGLRNDEGRSERVHGEQSQGCSEEGSKKGERGGRK